jgi:YHS domain-containing protein
MKSMLSLAAMVVLALGCSGSSQPAASDHSWNADFGRWGKDPVAGKLILRATAVKRDYQGVTYYFQNEAEARQFESSPTSYLSEPAPAAVDGQEIRHQSSVHSRESCSSRTLEFTRKQILTRRGVLRTPRRVILFSAPSYEPRASRHPRSAGLAASRSDVWILERSPSLAL